MADPMRQRNAVGSSYPFRWMKVRTPYDALGLRPGLQVVRVLGDPATETEASRSGRRTIRFAIDTIEADAHLPPTVASIAARSHISARALQKGFRRRLVVSPMGYLRDVRLRHVHQAPLDSNRSTETVASLASRWGFTNLGRLVQRTQPATANRP
jgi:AraC-like DNA-binding protein